MSRQTGETYLGDGLYASFDGFQVKLRAPREFGDHEVYLEPQVFRALVEFWGRCSINHLDLLIASVEETKEKRAL